VDYVGIFKDLKNALAIYGTGVGGGAGSGEMPVEAKQKLVNELRSSIEDAKDFLHGAGLSLEKIIKAKDEFLRLALMNDAVEAVLINDNSKTEFLTHAAKVERLFQAILPDVTVGEFSIERKAIQVLAERVRNNDIQDVPDLMPVMSEINRVLDKSIKVDETYVINPSASSHLLDLSKVDFEALKKIFDKTHKHTVADRLRGKITIQLGSMLQRNKSRIDYAERFEKMITEYNAGGKDIDVLLAELVTFMGSLDQEEKRGITENLSEEELAIFDLLTRPVPKLNKKEREQVKKVAKDLLDTLKAERLVLDWRKQQKTRASVRVAIFDALEQLPNAYDQVLYSQKCERVYQHVYDTYMGAIR
jgi:type I restriction enzyme R subunit